MVIFHCYVSSPEGNGSTTGPGPATRHHRPRPTRLEIRQILLQLSHRIAGGHRQRRGGLVARLLMTVVKGLYYINGDVTKQKLVKIYQC